VEPCVAISEPSRVETRRRKGMHAAEVERLLRLAADESGSRREELMEQATVAGVPIATSLARRYRHRGVDHEDLAQVAMVGLVKAVRGYEPGPVTDFRSYALPTIRGEVLRYFRDQAWMVRPPRRIQDLQAAISAAENELAAALHRWPSDEEIAAYLGVPVREVSDAQQAQGCFRPSSLDATVGGSSSLTLSGLIADRNDTYRLVEHVEALRSVVEELTPRDQLILHLRFVDHRTQAEIGSEIGVSQMQVSRLLREIMLALRSALLVA
jgi:RNA polymerase sigma-B factor